MPRLEALATATPPNRVPQGELEGLVADLVHEHAPEHDQVLRVFESSGVEERGLAAPLAWYLSTPGWEERAEAFEEQAVPLARRVVDELLDRAGLPAGSIDGVLAVNTTGVAAPSLDALVVNRLGLPGSAIRAPLWGYGCAGGVAGLARASELARAHPGKRFLLLSLELCSLAFLTEDLSKKSIVASALFGDGAAGALVTGDEVRAEGPGVGASASRLWPGTEDVMGWNVREDGLGVVFSPEIPSILDEKLAPFVGSFLKQEDLTMEQARPVFHPGGPKVLEAYQDALELPEGALEAPREVLARHGNMSSPTVLFALEATLERDPLSPGEPCLLGAVGPGFAGELALVTGR